MGPVKIEDLAALLGKSRAEVERMLQQDDVIELKLTESKRRGSDDDCNVLVMK